MLFAALIEKIRAWNAERRTRIALERLSRHSLDDIGVDADRIREVARQAALA